MITQNLLKNYILDFLLETEIMNSKLSKFSKRELGGNKLKKKNLLKHKIAKKIVILFGLRGKNLNIQNT